MNYDYIDKYVFLFCFSCIVILFLNLFGLIGEKEECKNINVNFCCESESVKYGN